jgi:hypothetical protein
MTREISRYFCAERQEERTGERQILMDIIPERILLRAVITVSVRHVRISRMVDCCVCSWPSKRKWCPYLPPDGVDMKLSNYFCIVVFIYFVRGKQIPHLFA